MANSEESLTDILVSLRSMFDTSSIDEIEIVHFLAFVLLIEQIANNNKHWEFSEKNKSHLNTQTKQQNQQKQHNDETNKQTKQLQPVQPAPSSKSRHQTAAIVGTRSKQLQ